MEKCPMNSWYQRSPGINKTNLDTLKTRELTVLPH